MSVETTGTKVVMAVAGTGIVTETIQRSVEQGSIFAEITTFQWIMATIALLSWMTSLAFGIYDRRRKRRLHAAKFPSPNSSPKE